jgi:hypothetical protein
MRALENDRFLMPTPSMRMQAEHLGGMDRLRRLHAIATTKQLDLRRKTEWDQAERLLMAEVATTVDRARTFDEALFCLARDRVVRLDEETPRTDIVLLSQEVARQRPDLAPSAQRRSTPEPEPIRLAEDERELKFAETVRSECARRGIMLRPDGSPLEQHATEFQAVVEGIASSSPHLLPDYKSRGTR